MSRRLPMSDKASPDYIAGYEAGVRDGRDGKLWGQGRDMDSMPDQWVVGHSSGFDASGEGVEEMVPCPTCGGTGESTYRACRANRPARRPRSTRAMA